jgi:hypothetical protein
MASSSANVDPQGAGDFFGAALAVGDLNDDGADDVAIGAPHDRHRGQTVGSVQVLYGRAELFP